MLGPVQKIHLMTEYSRLKKILLSEMYNEDFEDWIEQITVILWKNNVKNVLT